MLFGVVHTPIVDRQYGAVLTFKDPDWIQLEMFEVRRQIDPVKVVFHPLFLTSAPTR
ncbi:MAG: hypothetical protein ACLGI3_02925 [Actinomycetes bacterium]